MVKNLLSFFVVLIISQTAWAQCPGCIVDLPIDLAEDTIYLSGAPDGVVGIYYDGDLSFRMPKTTTPVAATDPDTPPGLTISQMTITSVTNLPPGLAWEANQTAFDPSEETDGCGKICGTPLLPGLFNVNVIVTAEVLLIEQTSSFSFPILILPGSSITEGFTLENGVGCGSVTPVISNNISSGGLEGFEYFWDFGEGTTSTEENPSTPVYDEAGIYELTYQAIVDTFGYYLSEVTVESTDCGDILGGAPDISVEVWDPSGERIFDSTPDNNTSFPFTVPINLFLGEGIYEIRVLDDDEGIEGGDDNCGTIYITQESNGSYTNGPLEVSVNIYHPIDTIQSVDTVIVHEQPEQPELYGIPTHSLCEGDLVSLFILYDSLNQWYQDTSPIFEATGPVLSVEESGIYWVTHTTEDGCAATSDTVNLEFAELPVAPVFQNFDNLLSLYDPGALPTNYTLQWYFLEQPIDGANDIEYCIDKDGSYTLEVYDQDTGCSSSYTLSVEYDPSFPDCMPLSTDEQWKQAGLNLYPNPANKIAWLEGGLSGHITIRIYHSNGALYHMQELNNMNEAFKIELSLATIAAGHYIVEVQNEKGQYRQQLLVY